MDQNTWIRTVKRKYDEFEDNPQFHVLGLDVSHVAHVEIKNECIALREMIGNQQTIIQELSLELDEERNASSTATNEAMSMILRLQREKAEIQMEARQFKRFSEEKSAHDSKVISILEDKLYKREQTIHSLTCEVQAYKHRMMSFGLREFEVDELLGDDTHNQSFSEIGVQEVDSPMCNSNDMRSMKPYDGKDRLRGKDRLKINRLGKTPRGYDLGGDVSRAKSVIEKVIVDSPKRHRNSRKNNSSDSPFPCGREMGPSYSIDSPRMPINCKKTDCVVEVSNKGSNASNMEDDLGDRVYTIDYVHQRVPHINGKESKTPRLYKERVATTPMISMENADYGDTDVNKLCLKLNALEADKESLRQTITAMQTDKAQLALLREITQQLCKDMPPERNMHMKKESVVENFSITKGLKWCLSIIFWRRSSRINKYICVLSPNKVGLLSILDKGQRTKHWRCITCTSLKTPLNS